MLVCCPLLSPSCRSRPTEEPSCRLLLSSWGGCLPLVQGRSCLCSLWEVLCHEGASAPCFSPAGLQNPGVWCHVSHSLLEVVQWPYFGPSVDTCDKKKKRSDFGARVPQGAVISPLVACSLPGDRPAPPPASRGACTPPLPTRPGCAPSARTPTLNMCESPGASPSMGPHSVCQWGW